MQSASYIDLFCSHTAYVQLVQLFFNFASFVEVLKFGRRFARLGLFATWLSLCDRKIVTVARTL